MSTRPTRTNTLFQHPNLLKSYHGKLKCPVCAGNNGIWDIKLDYLAVTGTTLTKVRKCRNCHVTVLYKTVQTQKPRYERVYDATGQIEERLLEPGRVAILATFNEKSKRDLARVFGVSVDDVQSAIEEATAHMRSPEAVEDALRLPGVSGYGSGAGTDDESCEQQGPGCRDDVCDDEHPTEVPVGD